MKTNKMPITDVLLVISWFIVIAGIFISAYLFISKGSGAGFLVAGFLILLISLIFGALIRMFANIGQIIFDIKREIQAIREINNVSVEHLNGLNQNLKIELQGQTLELEKIINGLDHNLKIELQGQTLELEKIINGLNQSLSTSISGLGQNLETELQDQTLELGRIINGLDQNLKAELQVQTLELEKIINGLNQSLSTSISGLDHDLLSEIKLLNAGLQNLSSSCEQINCDSKDLNQNINQIKNFFEQIERHLDLKQ